MRIFYGLSKIYKSEEIKIAVKESVYTKIPNPSDPKFSSRPFMSHQLTNKYSTDPFRHKIKSYIRDDIHF